MTLRKRVVAVLLTLAASLSVSAPAYAGVVNCAVKSTLRCVL